MSSRVYLWSTFAACRPDQRQNFRFCCHKDLAARAEAECSRILDVAGSPYEEDSGDGFNTDATRAAGVLVINRYDWSHYDSRGKAEEEDEVGRLALVRNFADPKKQSVDLISWRSTHRTKNSIPTLVSASSTTPRPAAPLGSGPVRASSCAARESTSSVGSASTPKATGRSGTTFSDVAVRVPRRPCVDFTIPVVTPSHDLTQ